MRKKQKKSDGEILRLEGELTIQRVGELKENFLKALAETEALSLDLGEVTEVDVACLQLLCSAHKTFMQSNKEFKTIGRTAPCFEKAVDDSGYRRKIGCHSDPYRNCLWVKGGADG